jgi:hypothetical protein
MPCTPVSQACDPDGELTPGEGADDKKTSVAQKKMPAVSSPPHLRHNQHAPVLSLVYESRLNCATSAVHPFPPD